MSNTKLLVVLGATGNQGGSVVDTFLDNPSWKIRGLTRNATSDKATKLAQRGVEVVSANLDDVSSLDRAFAGAHAIFVVSDFWGIYGDAANASKPAEGEPLNLWAARAEKQQLIHALEAASRVPSLERLVLSSLPNCAKMSGGKYKHVYHFDSKAQAAEHAAVTLPQLWAKTSVFMPGWFLPNYVANPMVMPVRVSAVNLFFSFSR